MVIDFVSHSQPLLLKDLPAFLIDVQAGMDADSGRLLPEDPTHVMNHPKHGSSHCTTLEFILMILEVSSIIGKLERQGLEVNVTSAPHEVYDAADIRFLRRLWQ